MPICATDACLPGARGYGRQCWITLAWDWRDDCEQPCAGSHTQQNHLSSSNGPVLSDRTILKRYLFVLSAGVPSKIYHQQAILRGVYTNDLKEILFLFLIFFVVCMKTNTNGVSSLDYLEQIPRLLTHVCDSFSHSRESLRISLSLFLFTTFHIKVFRPISCLFHASFFF